MEKRLQYIAEDINSLLDKTEIAVDTEADRELMTNTPIAKAGGLGRIVYVKATKKSYQYNTETGEWAALPAISIKIDDEMSNTSENPVQNKVISGAMEKKVDKVEGKGLSANDFTTEEKTKLEGIEEKAQVNTISSISLNGTALTPDSNKNVEVTIPETKVDGTTIKTADSGAIQAVGVKTLSDLIVTGDTIYNGTIPVMKSGDILDLVKYVMSSSQNFKECPFIYIDGTITQSLLTKEDAIKNKVLLRYLGGDSSTYFYFEAYNVMATKQEVTEAVSYCTLTGLTTVGSISNVDNYKNAIIQIVKSNSVRIADFQYVKSGVEVDNTTITKNANSQIQAIALTNGTDTIDYEALKKAMTITIEE